MGYCPQGHKELDRSEQLTLSNSITSRSLKSHRDFGNSFEQWSCSVLIWGYLLSLHSLSHLMWIFFCFTTKTWKQSFIGCCQSLPQVVSNKTHPLYSISLCVCVCVCVCVCARALSCSVVSKSLWPHGLLSAWLLCSWDFPGKNAGVGCHLLLQGIFPTQGSNAWLLHLLHWQANFYHCISWEALLLFLKV